jgi:hypothetical protein
MIADSFLDVIGMPNFLAFHSPVMVSNTIANPIKNNIPEIGKKKAPITANNCIIYCLIEASKMANCILIVLI